MGDFILCFNELAYFLFALDRVAVAPVFIGQEILVRHLLETWAT